MGQIDDPAVLEEFFRKRSSDPDSVKVVDYSPITGGYSRAMARVWVEEAAGRRGYIVRSDPPAGQSIIDTDRGAEWAVVSALSQLGSIPMPAPLWFDPTGEELGSPTIVTELIDGQSLLGLAATCDPVERAAMGERFCDVASIIHTVDTTGLADHLKMPASWEDYMVARIQEWVDAERAFPDADPFMRLIASWLRANKPPPARLGLVHGDFQPTNIVVDSEGNYFMVDWELAHIGDPREDLGWMALCGVTQPPNLIEHEPEAFYERYRQLTGMSEELINPATIAYFTVLGGSSVFIPVIERLALLVQGETTSMSVAYMAPAVSGMHNVFINAMAAHAVASGGAS
jgi:aminoglycoside phosphotransferase (APT) family kinase protein